MHLWILSLALASAAGAEPPTDVAVMPMMVLEAAPAPRYDSYVTRHVPAWRAELRRQRSREVAQLPTELAKAIPGAVHANLGTTWEGHFRGSDFPMGRERGLTRALRSQDQAQVERSLGALGRHSGADYTLVMWTQDLQSVPLTAQGFPGQLVHTGAGPVLVDLVQEQHRVLAVVGVAVVDRTGQIRGLHILPAEGIISLRDRPRATARYMAISLARELRGAGLSPSFTVASR